MYMVEGSDRRRWCSKKTTHSLDLVMAAPVRGDFNPTDIGEVAHVGWIDAYRQNPEAMGYGHARVLDEWAAAISQQGELKFREIL